MARRRSGGGEGGGDTWLNTYADMVTLLLTFFAVLLSMSSVDAEKFQALVMSLTGRAPTDIPQMEGPATGNEGVEENAQVGTLVDLYEYLATYVNEKGLESEIQLTQDEVTGVIYIRFNSSLLFRANDYRLQGETVEYLSDISDKFVEVEEDIDTINICGHTNYIENDNYPISGWMLSSERAASVAIYIQDEKGFPREKLLSVGYGGNYPVGDNTTAEGQRQNRRVELIIVGKGVEFDLSKYNSADIDFGEPLEGGYGNVMDPEAPDGTPVMNTTAAPEDTGPPLLPAGPVQRGVSPYDD